MPNKTPNDQTKVLVAIKKLGSSLAVEIRKGDKLIRQEILKVEERVEGLEESFEYMESRLQRVEHKAERVEAKMDKVDQKLDKLQNTLDGFVGNVGKLTEDNVIGTEHYRDHEVRISKLESSVQPA